MILGSVILAGGRSRRMGRPKESLPFGDTTMLGHTVDTLLTCTFPVIVVARDTEQDLPPLTLEADVLFDDQLDQGPLAGMMSGLRAVRGDCDAVFVTGCDSPFLLRGAVDWLAHNLGDHDLVICRVDDVLQPLAAIYRVSILETIERLIGDGVRTPRSLAESCNARILTEVEVDAFDPSRSFLKNINSPADYEDAIRQIDS